MPEENFDQRLTEQVTTLSTKLVTAVAKSSEFEEALLQARKENSLLKASAEKNAAAAAEKCDMLQTEKERVAQQLAQLQEQLQTLQVEKNAAEEKNKQLEGEVEDLTASLFNEANEMVSNASREAYNFKLKNRKLFEELDEKDSIIANLQDELKDLKELFIKMEESTRNASSRTNTPKVGPNADRFSDNDHPMRSRGPAVPSGESSVAGDFADDLADDELACVMESLVYGTKTRSIRLDLPQYQQDFKAFVYQIIRKDFSFDLASLKALKYFKRVWTAEIEPSLGSQVPALTGATFMNRWSKGKTFWSLIVEGKAVIEPVAGVNETFKLSYKGAKSGAVPVALREPCGVCGEAKDDLLEHARLYTLKLYGPATDLSYKSTGNPTITIAGETHDVVGSYPLCNYCLVKLRAICDFFAKLRSIHSNMYKLQQNSSFDAVAFANSFQFKRSSSEALSSPASHADDEPVFIKLYLMLLVVRAKIFWAGVGFWDTQEDVENLNFDDIKSDIFKKYIKENVAYSETNLEEVPIADGGEGELPKHDPTATSETASVQPDSKEEEEFTEVATEKVSGADANGTDLDQPSDVDAVPASQLESKTEEKTVQQQELTHAEPVPVEPPTVAETSSSTSATSGKVGDMIKQLNGNNSPRKKGKKKGKAQKAKEEEEETNDEEFQDTSEEFQGEAPLSRRKSKSKAFKKKMNKDLDNTLSMLQESIE